MRHGGTRLTRGKRVAGSRHIPYAVAIDPDEPLETWCTGPVKYRCKHKVVELQEQKRRLAADLIAEDADGLAANLADASAEELLTLFE